MKDKIPTVEQFAEILGEYHGRINRRMNRLGGLFLGLVGIMFGVMIAGVIFSKSLFVLIPISVAGIALIGVYVIVSSSKWHKANGVFCNHCGKNLLGLSEEYEVYLNEGETLPNELHCPRCKKLIAGNNTWSARRD